MKKISYKRAFVYIFLSKYSQLRKFQDRLKYYLNEYSMMEIQYCSIFCKNLYKQKSLLIVFLTDKMSIVSLIIYLF